jgi:polyisoprenoid-binding protein YceI
MKRIAGILSVLLLASAAYAQTYSIDPNHSSVNFTVRHLVGRVTGHFDKFEGTFDYDAANAKSWKTAAMIDAASVDTGIQKRDDHLRSADFFDVSKFPSLLFKSTGVTDVNGMTAKLHGDLTIHGVTKPVVLDLQIGGTVKNPMGPGERAGATATGKINRHDFGINGPTAMGSMIGDDVDMVINVEGVSK